MTYPQVKIYGSTYAVGFHHGSVVVVWNALDPKERAASAYRCSACGEVSTFGDSCEAIRPEGCLHVKSIPSLPTWDLVDDSLLPPKSRRWKVELPAGLGEVWVGSYCDGRFRRVDPILN